MSRLISMRSAVLLAVTAGALAAADVSGKWTAQMTGPDGDSRTIAFDFKQDGQTLTGTVQGPNGEALQIKDGKVEGNHISFKLSPGGDESMRIAHDGTIQDDAITLNIKMEGGSGRGPGGRAPDGQGQPGPGGRGGPDGGPQPMTLKRAN